MYQDLFDDKKRSDVWLAKNHPELSDQGDKDYNEGFREGIKLILRFFAKLIKLPFQLIGILKK